MVTVDKPTTIWWNDIRPDADTLNRLGTHSMQAALGIEVTEIGEDFLVGRMPVDARTHQPRGRLHGGASVALAETLGTLAAVHTLDQSNFMAVGMEINANHVRPARDGWVTGTARPESRGRTTQIWSIRITDDNNKLICISRFTAAIITIERN